MTHILDYVPSDKTLAEIVELDKMRNELLEKVDSSERMEDFCERFLTSVHGREYVEKTKFSSKMKVLDIGVGRGESSLYLASMGHEVYAVEPSPALCDVLHIAANKYGFPLKIYQGVAEHLDQIEENEFDVCVFNSSFHHCDDPQKALDMCYKKMKKGGVIHLINEPILKFFRTKKWYFKMLDEDPVRMGHYGGNEHIYYYQEYVKMFKKAGFCFVKHTNHVKYVHLRDSIRDDLASRIDGQYVNSNKKVFVKFFVLLVLERLSRSRGMGKIFFSLAVRLSLLPVSFQAEKI